MIEVSKVFNVSFDGIDHRDAPDYVDAYISEAWIREGERERELTETEILWIEKHKEDWVYDKLMDCIY